MRGHTTGAATASRRRAFALAVLGLVLAAGWLAARPASAAGSHLVTVGPDDLAGADVVLAGQTFDEVAAALAGDTAPAIGLPIPGMGTIPDLPMDLAADDVNRILTLTTAALGDYLPAGSPLAGTPAELLLIVDWTDVVTDEDPAVVLAVRLGEQLLSSIHPGFGPLDGLAGELGLEDAVLLFSDGPTTLDPDVLAPEVAAFLGVDGALSEDLLLGATAELLGAIDVDSIPVLRSVIDYLGADPDDVQSLAGSLADTAALLFDPDPTLDPADLTLEGSLDSTQLPTWMQDRLPAFSVTLGPDPSIEVHDQFEIVTPDGTANSFSYDLSLAEVAGLDVTVHADGPFTPPFGLGWIGDLNDAALHLVLGAGGFDATFDAQLTIGSSTPTVHIRVSDAADATTGLVDIEGDVGLDDVVTWLNGSGAFGGGGLDASAVENVTLHELHLGYEAGAGGHLLYAFADTTVPTPSFLTEPATVHAEVLLAARRPLASAPTFLAGLEITDPTCTVAPPCIHLGTLLPFPQGEFAAKVTVPAVNVVTILPSGSTFDPDGLAPEAAAFLTRLVGAPPTDPFAIEGTLELSAEVPLGTLAPALAQLGASFPAPDPVARFHGVVDFDLSALGDGATDEPLASFAFDAALPSATFELPPRLRAWSDAVGAVVPGAGVELTTGDWTMFLRGTTDGDVELGVALPGLELDLGAGPIDLSAEGRFAGSPDGDFTLTMGLALDAPVVAPFGIDFLTIDDAALGLSISSIAGDASAEVSFSAGMQIGTEHASLVLVVDFVERSLTLTVSLDTTVFVSDVLAAFGANSFAASLPTQVKGAGFGPAEVTLRVDGDGVDVDAVVDIVAPLFAPGQNLALSVLFSAEFPTGGDPRFTVGARPSAPLTLGGLLGHTLEPDFTLIGDDAGLGIVFSSAPLDPTSGDRTDTLRDWFDPLLVDGLELPPLIAGVSGLGRLPLPSVVGDVMEQIGVLPEAQLLGTIPIPGTSALEFGAKLYLAADPNALPWMIDSASLHLGITVATDPSPKVSLTAGGTMVLLVKQGLDDGIANALASIGIQVPLPVADEVESDANPTEMCEPGGVIRAEDVVDGTAPNLTVEQRYYCMDRLVITVDGEVNLQPSDVQLVIGGGITYLSDVPGTAWHPFALDWIGIRQLKADLSVKYTFATQAVTFEVGVLGNVDLFGKNFSGALQMGISIQPAPTPVGFVVTPSFGGVRATFSELSVADLLALQAGAADLLGQPPLPSDVADAIPNIALRNLELSFSPLGVPRLCIPAGIVIRGDLYVNPTGDPPLGEPPCDPDAPPGAPPDSELCPAQKVNGCVAGVLLRITLDGIVANGFLAGFDLSPALPIRWDDVELDLRLTLAQQYLKLSGGAGIGPVGAPWASGELAVSLEPTALSFFGRLQVFGFNTLVDARLETLGDDDPLALLTDPSAFNPNLSLHAVFADATFDLGGDPDFDDALADLAEPHLARLERVVVFLDQVLADLEGGDPLGVLLRLPARLQARGIAVPPWIASLAAEVETWRPKLDERGAELLLDAVLNGIHLDSVPGTWVPASRTCFGVDLDLFDDGEIEPSDALGTRTKGPDDQLNTADDQCWSIVHVIPGVWVDPARTSILIDLPRIEFPAACIGLVVSGDCILFPAIDFDGVCTSAFPHLGPTCTLPEIRGEVEDWITDALGSLGLDLSGLDLSAIVARIRAFLDGDGELFVLRCAEADVQVSLQGQNQATLALAVELFGEPVGASFTWQFADPAASVRGLLEELWAVATGTANGPACGGVDLDVFGSDAAAGDFRPETSLPPLELTATTTPKSIDEGGSASVNVAFNRVLTEVDGARLVTVSWGAGEGSSSATVAVGQQSVSLSHTYADDDPTGTSSDLYTVRATSSGVADDTDTVRVRNRIPAVTVDRDVEAVDEGGTVTLTLGITDAGSRDSHQAEIRWGDGTVEVVDPVTDGHVVAHTYLDDDPTGTPSDLTAIQVAVTDDDGGRRTAATSVTVRNVEPDAAAVAITPATVREGALVTYTVAFTDPGSRDVHAVRVDWDGDGTFDTTRPVPVGDRSVQVTHLFDDDHPATGTPSDLKVITVEVTDDDLGSASVSRSLTVENVPPRACLTLAPGGFPAVPAGCPAAAARTIDEGGSVELNGTIADPGLPDTHRVVIDWGDDAFADTVIELDGSRTFSASQTYGDNGVFGITVTVTDDDTGSIVPAATVTVDNVDPTVAIDETAALAVAGGPTLFTREGEPLSVAADVDDPGSDDLTVSWNWDDGTAPSTRTHWVIDAGHPDPLPSPSVDPRAVRDGQTHAWADACLYRVTASAADDDAGAGADATWVVVTGNAAERQVTGWWAQQYKEGRRNRADLPAARLQCYLAIVRHVSAVFDEIRFAGTSDAARVILDASAVPNMSSELLNLDRQLMAAWLNLAHGSIGWDTLVDTDGDRRADTGFLDYIQAAESARLDAGSSRQELLRYATVLERINEGRA